MTQSNFLGIPHTGHDKTDGWVHKGEHWLEHSAEDAADTLDEGASEIVDTAVAAVHAALSTIGTDALKSLLISIWGLAEHVAPNKTSEIPIIPFTVFTPGIGLELNIRDNLATIRKYARQPPHGQREYIAMLHELADDEYAIVHLPNGVGKIPVKIQMIDREIEKLPIMRRLGRAGTKFRMELRSVNWPRRCPPYRAAAGIFVTRRLR